MNNKSTTFVGVLILIVVLGGFLSFAGGTESISNAYVTGHSHSDMIETETGLSDASTTSSTSPVQTTVEPGNTSSSVTRFTTPPDFDLYRTYDYEQQQVVTIQQTSPDSASIITDNRRSNVDIKGGDIKTYTNPETGSPGIVITNGTHLSVYSLVSEDRGYELEERNVVNMDNQTYYESITGWALYSENNTELIWGYGGEEYTTDAQIDDADNMLGIAKGEITYTSESRSEWVVSTTDNTTVLRDGWAGESNYYHFDMIQNTWVSIRNDRPSSFSRENNLALRQHDIDGANGSTYLQGGTLITESGVESIYGDVEVDEMTEDGETIVHEDAPTKSWEVDIGSTEGGETTTTVNSYIFNEGDSTRVEGEQADLAFDPVLTITHSGDGYVLSVEFVESESAILETIFGILPLLLIVIALVAIIRSIE